MKSLRAFVFGRRRNFVYIVGSMVPNCFVADQVYDNEDEAIAYCNSRCNNTCPWCVMKAPIGAMWINWVRVHLVPRKD